MDTDLILKIDRLIEECREELEEVLAELVRIKSVKGEAMNGAPFGEGPRKVLDTVLKIGEEEGFFCTDYGVGVISLSLKEGNPDMGIWMHADVVEEGDGWSFPPYGATKYKGRIIGRGASDNKGSVAVMLMLFKIFKSLDIKLNYNPAIYVGSNEETGMEDMTGSKNNPRAKGFLNVCEPPRLSLVPDGGSFPVGYGGKGGIKLSLKSVKPLHGFSFVAGEKNSPGTAKAVFDSENCELVVHTPPFHSASPNPDGNMITRLSEKLLEEGLAGEEDRSVIEFLKDVSLDIYGNMFNINVANEEMGPLTVCTIGVNCPDKYPELILNIRYPLGFTYEEIIERVRAKAKDKGFVISEAIRGVDPYIMNPEREVIRTLTEVANSVTGDNKKPFIMSGGTYAHRLPNALVYGIDGCRPPEDFEDGRGRAHGVDEAVSLDYLQRAMKIYARAFLALDETDWSK